MRAFEVLRRGIGRVAEVDAPSPRSDEVVVAVRRAGVCGTDVGLFNGDGARIERARTTYPLRLGHEWAGVVVELGDGVDASWLGRRVIGDTMIGCGHCERCIRGRHQVCADRYEIGVRGGWPGAFAEQLPVPTRALHMLPDGVTDAVGALVEPGGNAVRAVDAALVERGTRMLVIGGGAIGLLTALFADARGAEVTVLGRRPDSLALAGRLGLTTAVGEESVTNRVWDAVVDATDSPDIPAHAADLVEPGGRVVLIGVSVTPSLIDSRVLLHKDVTAVGILGGSAGLDAAIAGYASGAVDPLPLVADTIGLGDLDDLLAGRRERDTASPPKVQVDPAR